MTDYKIPFGYARWVARQITGPKNIDKKIFIVGDSGDGKSLTAMALAKAISRWVSFYNHGDFDHAADYFTFDADHVAVISTDDLIRVMTKRLAKNSIKIVDDCGAARGFTNRRAMTDENLDIVSILGTNRVQNGVAIYCVQTEDFTDVRMRLLANEKIDLTDYYQSVVVFKYPDGREVNVSCRIAKLFKIKRDKRHKNRITECRFMTYNCGQMETIEGIVCFMPDKETAEKYNELRDRKEKENSQAINEKYDRVKQTQEVKDTRPRCKVCGSVNLEYRKAGMKCKRCGALN